MMSSPSVIEIKTRNEQLLVGELKKERARCSDLETIVYQLKERIAQLEQKIDQPLTQRDEAAAESIQYETDEEELAKETEWVRQKSRKKRKLNTSPSPMKEVTCNKVTKEKPKKEPLPPPIIVENVIEYQSFYDSLLKKELNKDSFTVKMLRNGAVKINTNSEATYRGITKHLKEEDASWFSYENKQSRPIRVMAKNLHASCKPERIVEDLILQGFKILDAAVKYSWKNKEPLNMFILSFHHQENIKNIYEIKSILGCKIDVQPLKSPKLIPQCKRCQAYGHTQKYCSKEPRCVKCTAKHLTVDCNKPRDAKPKCVHCGESHPANYRGCVVAKELQKMRNVLKSKSKIETGNSVKPAKAVSKTVSFAQVTKGPKTLSSTQQNETANTGIDEKINTILSLLTSFDERLKKLESGTKIAASKRLKQ